MAVPITTRLDDDTIAALDDVVRGSGLTRAAVIANAVRDWLARHSEDAIAASYRHPYAAPDAEHDELVARLSAYAVAVADQPER